MALWTWPRRADPMAVALFAGVTLCLPLRSGEALDVHARAGHIAYLEREGNAPLLRLTRRGTSGEILLRPAAGVSFKEPFVRGFAVLEKNRLGVILADEARLDPAHQRVLVYDLANPEAAPVEWPVRKALCARLAVADADKLWCLGEGDDHNLLHLLGPKGRAGSLLRATAERGAGSGRLGMPQLLSMPQGVIAWLPDGGGLIMFTGSSTGVEIPLPPYPPSGRTMLSFVLVDSGALLALAPLLESGEETLRTRYCLFVFVPREKTWRRRKPERDFTRGTVLVGNDGQELAIWHRARNEVEFVTVQ